MNIIVKGKKIIIGEKVFLLEQLDSSDIEKYYNNNINYYFSDCEIVNEVFIKYAHLYEYIKNIIDEYNVNEVKCINADETLLSCARDAIGKKVLFCNKILAFIYQYLFILFSFLYLSSRVLTTKYVNRNICESEGFYISRAKADIKMINVLANEKIVGFYDDFYSDKSIYTYFTLKQKITILLHSLNNSNKRLNSYCDYVKDKYGVNIANNVRKFYSARVVHTLVYEECINIMSKNFYGKKIYTADNLDRFALIQERTANLSCNYLICIPHGIEYGFILPHCFVGDLFYTTTENAAQYLNKKYKTNKFIYNSTIASKMFSVSHIKEKTKKLVYFTEPRESYINVKIISKLCQALAEYNITLNIKLHPKDNPDDYKTIIKKVNIINDFQTAITNSICIARKSTVLIEALYNDSKPVAILVNQKDKEIYNTFPSLQDNRIDICYSTRSLIVLISQLIKNENN